MAAEQQFNIKFVKEIKKYPCLYNSKLPEYMRKDMTEKVWKEIGNKFNLSGPECKEKWKNLRSVFVRHLRPPKSGSASTHKKPYYLSDYMQFASPFIKIAGNTSRNSPDKLHNEADVPSLNDDDIPKSYTVLSLENLHVLSSQSLSTETEATQSQPQPELPCIQQVANESQLEKYRPQKIYRKKGGTLEKVIADYFKTKQASLPDTSEKAEENSNKMFLLSILSDMNKMNDQKKRVFKRRLLELVDEIMEQE